MVVCSTEELLEAIGAVRRVHPTMRGTCTSILVVLSCTGATTEAMASQFAASQNRFAPQLIIPEQTMPQIPEEWEASYSCFTN